MADREQIRDVLADYGWGNDAKDEAALNSVFHDDARFALTIEGVDEPIGPFEGREAIVGFIYPTVRDQTDQRRHVIVNHRFVVDEPERARVRAYLVLLVTDAGELEAKSTGVYDVWFALRGGAWKITSMDLALDRPF
ncbi:MAG TPA: nuclear transport factor 2 family protein [Solirubrobacteraceae bacterium]|nr:nuclear transport factor 2 family protein [Solirubrobacteraceae bacterium]